MRKSHVIKLLLLPPLLVAALMWGEHERRRLTLIGTWEAIQVGVNDNASSDHLYQVLNGDGTGEDIIETNGRQVATIPFTYRFSGFSRLEFTCDWTFYGNEVVPLDDPRLVNPPPPERNELFFIYVGLDRDRIYMNPNNNKSIDITWHRVPSEPSPEER